MTAAGVGRPPAVTASARGRRTNSPRLAALRLVRLHAASRRVLTCLFVLAAGAIALRTALHWLPRTGVYSRQIPLTIEAGAAVAIGVTTRSPFGEPERVTGRWLPWLRLAVSLALAGAAVGALAAGSASAHLAGGTGGMARDVAGFTGIALLAAAVAGGGLAWIGPVAYLAVTLPALGGHWATPWIWPARPPHDRGAAACAALVFAAGLVVVTVRGARDAGRASLLADWSAWPRWARRPAESLTWRVRWRPGFPAPRPRCPAGGPGAARPGPQPRPAGGADRGLRRAGQADRGRAG